MAEQFEVEAIARVSNSRTEPIDDNWDSVPTKVELDTERFGADALMGLESFSYVQIVFLFDQVDPEIVVEGARHPRGQETWPKVGIFAQRGKNRPNRIGTTICRVVAVEGTRLYVVGLDAIDGTPVLDIKPVMSGFLPRGDITEPRWAKDIMANYW